MFVLISFYLCISNLIQTQENPVNIYSIKRTNILEKKQNELIGYKKLSDNKLKHYKEIDVLNKFKYSKSRSSKIIQKALNIAGKKEITELVLRSEKWEISNDLIIPKNIFLRIEDGAILSISKENKIIVEGLLLAGPTQIFNKKGKVYFKNPGQKVCPIWWKKKEDSSYNYAIQMSFLSGARFVYFPEGIYEVSISDKKNEKTIKIPNDITIIGEREHSIIKLIDTPITSNLWAAYIIFKGDNVENITFENIVFDGENFYPNPELISRLDPNIRGTRAVQFKKVKNLRVKNCTFKGFNNGSLYVTGKNVNIENTKFYHGSYRSQVVRLDGSQDVKLTNCVFEDNGPHYYMNLGREYETSSTDAIMVGYHVNKATIEGNKIYKTSGSGIRIELSQNISIIKNKIIDAGQNGITFYKNSKDSICKDNFIRGWGKLNNFGYIRKQNKKIYNPREYHYKFSQKPQLPLKLKIAKTWEENRYYLQGREESAIPEYDHYDYENVRAFRGYSGIAVTNRSVRIEIINNIIIGNTSKTNGLYNYASNFGINIGVHSVNPPTNSGSCKIIGNTISNCIDFDLYCPKYVDPTSKKGIASFSTLFNNKYEKNKISFYYQNHKK